MRDIFHCCGVVYGAALIQMYLLQILNPATTLDLSSVVE